MKISIILGTRPEAIKLAPVIEELRRHPHKVVCDIINTGQHREMVCQALSVFNIQPDVNFETMAPGQSLGWLTSRLFFHLDELFYKERPDWVLVQGDTTTAMAAAMTAFYHSIKVGHVE